MVKMRKLVSLTLALVLLAGCMKATDKAQSVGVTSSEESAGAVENKEKVKINWLGYYTSSITVAENSYAEKLLEETFDVEINPITDVSSDNINVFVSSGDILDVTCFSSYLKNDFQYMYDQNLIREIPQEWLYEYFPTGMKIYEEHLGTEFFEKGGHLVNDVCLYTPFTTTTNTSEYVTVFRKDWMDHLGISEPKTLNEFHDLLYAFTYNDPDGNGVKDTYGIDMSWGWMGLWPVYGAFGFVNNSNSGNFYLQEDGSVVYTTASKEYQSALEVIKEWYDEGIIDPNCITDDRSAVRTKWADGGIGVMVDSQTWFYSNRGASNIIALAEDVFGQNTVDVLGPLTSQYGDGKVYSALKYPDVSANRALVFTADATDEQVIAVLNILEGMTADHDLYTKIVFGEEGVDYTTSDNGRIVVSPDATIEHQASKGIGDTYYGYGAQDEHIRNLTFSDRDLANREKSDSWPTLYWANNFPSTQSEIFDRYYAEVKKVEEEFYYSVLLGTRDIHADWDAYLTALDNAGLGKIIADYEKLLK